MTTSFDKNCENCKFCITKMSLPAFAFRAGKEEVTLKEYYFCRRNPKEEPVYASYWCGEYKEKQKDERSTTT